MKVQIEAIEQAKDKVVGALKKYQQKESKLHYADVRLEISEGKGCGALQGNVKGAAEDYYIDLGVRAMAKPNGLLASGFVGKVLGKSDLDNIEKVAAESLETAFKRAKFNAGKKAELKAKSKFFGKMIHSQELAETKICQDYVKARFKKNPRDVSLEELVKRTEKHSKELMKLAGMASNSIYVETGFFRKLFASTEGAVIDQEFALTEAFYYVVAKGKAFETFHETLGDNCGLEVLDGENVFEKSFEEMGKYLAEGTIELSNAPAAKSTAKEVTVITDPWYNALLSHEITGHPSEADRALKRESAWAGRAWWFRNIEDNEFGKQVASEQLSVFSDPRLENGYGTYKYDDEGVKAKKIYNIKNGVLNEFLNSRETAAILGKEPNGGMRASAASLVPIIRMNNTCFEAGNWKKEEIFEETKKGYYVVGQKTPSIGETRQNFRITCWKLYKIENGEIGQLYRHGGVMADSPKYLQSVDAIGDDFKLFNIPNCGKGTPMQVMKLGNGGPHLRGRAHISGSEESV